MHSGSKFGFAWLNRGGAAKHFGVDYRGADGIDANALLAIFHCSRTCEAKHGVLASSVDAHFRRGAQGGNRGGVDDSSTAAFQHQGYFKAHALPDAFNVDVHDAVEHGLVAVGQFAALDLDTRVIESAVKAAVVSFNLFNKGLDLFGVSDIAGDKHGIPTVGGNALHHNLTVFNVDIRGDHPRAGGGKGLCGRHPNTRCGSCHQYYLAGKLTAHCYYLLTTVIGRLRNPRIAG